MTTPKLITTFYSSENGELLSQVNGMLLDYKEDDTVNLEFSFNCNPKFDLFLIVEREYDNIALYGHTITRKYNVFKKFPK